MAKHDYDWARYRITTIVSRLNIGERLFLPDLAMEFGVFVYHPAIHRRQSY